MKIFSELPLGKEPLHTVGGKDLCDLFEISPVALTDLKKRGIAVHLSHDTYDLTATTRAYVQHLRGMAAGWGTGDPACLTLPARLSLAASHATCASSKSNAS